MFRVYDDDKKQWIEKDVYLAPSGRLIMKKKTGLIKSFVALDHTKCICHRAIDLWDKNGVQVYEGDYVEATVGEERTVIGLVTFAQELSSYIILVDDSNEYFTLGSEVSKFISVIGNVFDGYRNEADD